ncbi:hypothetical protein CLU96_2528 [Chryseobacterium sp. 52]|nr:hypothetical protein CLU96_2528 [Chryseobacterium sp. 52]
MKLQVFCFVTKASFKENISPPVFIKKDACQFLNPEAENK